MEASKNKTREVVFDTNTYVTAATVHSILPTLVDSQIRKTTELMRSQ